MTIWHGMIKVVEVKKFNKDMAVADKDNRDNNIQDNSTQDNNKIATTSSELQLKVVSINNITNSVNNNSNNNNGIKLLSRHSG